MSRYNYSIDITIGEKTSKTLARDWRRKPVGLLIKNLKTIRKTGRKKLKNYW